MLTLLNVVPCCLCLFPLWALRLYDVVKAFWHPSSPQWYGFSPNTNKNRVMCHKEAPWRPLSLSYQKKDARFTFPSFIWSDTEFENTCTIFEVHFSRVWHQPYKIICADSKIWPVQPDNLSQLDGDLSSSIMMYLQILSWKIINNHQKSPKITKCHEKSSCQMKHFWWFLVISFSWFLVTFRQKWFQRFHDLWWFLVTFCDLSCEFLWKRNLH